MRNFSALIRRAILIAASIAPLYVMAAPDRQIQLLISPEGVYTLDGIWVTEENLLAKLRALREQEPRATLNIESERQQGPSEVKARQTIAEAGFGSVTWTDARVIEQRRRAARRREEVLLWGGIELGAVLLCAPFALTRKTRQRAFLTGFLGVWGAGSLIALLVGAFADYQKAHAGHWSGGLIELGMLIVAFPLSCVTGLVAGALFSFLARSKKHAAKGADPA